MAKPQDNKYFIDLFAGAGGLSCGLELAGFKPVLANELVDVYAETYQLNHPDTEVIIGDVRQVDERHLHNLVKQYGEIDIIAGGPPCQGFSVNAPTRSLEDPRNHLFREFLRIVKEIRPRAVIIENVPGIVSLEKGRIADLICSELNQLGYNTEYKILFAGHYGVPQMRFRTVFIGIRDYDGVILFPEPEYNSAARANFYRAKELCYDLPLAQRNFLKPQVNVWDAISDLPLLQGGESCVEYDYNKEPESLFQQYVRQGSYKLKNHCCSKLSRINIERLKYIKQGGSWRDIPWDLLPAGLKRARRSDHTKRYGRLSPESLCSTILTKCDPHWGSFFHPFQDRVISVREAARLQSFPDNYIFKGNLTQQYEQVGNSVPPLLARAIGEKLDYMIGDYKSAAA